MPELSDISLNRLAVQVQAALLRLHIMFTAETHRLLTEYGDQVWLLLKNRADEDGTLDAIGMFSVVTEATELWRETFTAWLEMFQAARVHAAAIPFGRLARQHQAMMALAERKLAEQKIDTASPVFKPQLEAVLNAANQRLYSDGFQLSERLWRFDHYSQEGIRRTLLKGMAEGDSAWNVAKELEKYLGADADCPRWSSTRLFKLTPTDRMISRTGLYSSMKGTPCKSVGVSYNALRLARTEYQFVHHMATREIFSQTPWIEKEQICLSPDHPPIGCECEDIVAGGEKGEGIYPVGQITLPVHPNCLCFPVAVLMPGDAFVYKLRNWMRGEADWNEMDSYGTFLGVSAGRLTEPELLATWGTSLTLWLWGNREKLAGALGIDI